MSISIPVIISGVDAEGKNFSEGVRTLIVNKHGGKIATTNRLAMGAEVLIENLALGAFGKAYVVWLGEKRYPGGVTHLGLQMVEAQNVWGIAFPPDDWASEPPEETSPALDAPPTAERAGPVSAETPVSSLAGEEITIRLLQELQESADAHAREFQDRLKQLATRMGMELEFDLRERAAYAKAHEVGALEKEIKVLRGIVSAARQEIERLDARIEELQDGFEAVTPAPPPPPLPEVQQQLTALLNAAVESMNRAAEAGLTEYRRLLEQENQKTAARTGLAAHEKAAPPTDPAPKS